MHGKDTQYIARTFYKGTAVIKHMGKGETQLETIVLNRSLYEQLLRDALVEKANRVVELYEGHGASWQISKCAPLPQTTQASAITVYISQCVCSNCPALIMCALANAGSIPRPNLCRQASPGQLAAFEDELFRSNDMVDAPIIMSAISNISEGVRTVGVAFVDVAGRRIGVAQFDDSDQLCDLERTLIQLGVRECVLPQVPLLLHSLALSMHSES